MWIEYILFFGLLLLPYFLQRVVVKDVRESDIYTRVGWGIILLSIADISGSQFLFFILLLILVVFSTADVIYGWTFRGQFSLAAIEALVFTNKSEAVEFIHSYFSLKNIFIVTFYISVVIYWANSSELINYVIAPGLIVPLQLVALLLVIYLAVLIIRQKKFQGAFPGIMGLVLEYFKQYRQQQRLIALRHNLSSHIKKISSITSENNLPKTVFVVIGESSSRRHYSLYGYERDTNPLLTQHNDLICFTDVISAFSQTNPSLSYLLTSASSQNEDSPEVSPSIVDAAKALGYKTIWISNQELSRSLPQAIAESSDSYTFCPGIKGDQFDEVVLPHVMSAIADEAEYKLIVVHLMGSHLKYSLRYPPSFDRFKDEEGQNPYKSTISNTQIQSINEYDNSIVYTDYVLERMLVLLKQLPRSVFLYVSDHGEEVYDTRNFKGHEPENPSLPMLEVPMIMWLSSDLDHKRIMLKKNKDMPALVDDVFHLLLDLMGGGLINNDAALVRNLASAQYAINPRKAYQNIID